MRSVLTKVSFLSLRTASKTTPLRHNRTVTQQAGETQLPRKLSFVEEAGAASVVCSLVGHSLLVAFYSAYRVYVKSEVKDNSKAKSGENQ